MATTRFQDCDIVCINLLLEYIFCRENFAGIIFMGTFFTDCGKTVNATWRIGKVSTSGKFTCGWGHYSMSLMKDGYTLPTCTCSLVGDFTVCIFFIFLKKMDQVHRSSILSNLPDQEVDVKGI